MEPTIKMGYDSVGITWENISQSFDVYELHQAVYSPILDAVVIVGHEEIIIVPRNNSEVFRMWTR